ncbi:MAG: alpha/beta hydrolase [Clostridiales bacterium]|nr:alpha/beta hydrolase [Clostridiales bacterium]
MASIVSSILRSQIKLLNPIIRGMTIEQSRKGQDAVGKIGSRALEGSVHYKLVRFPLFDAAWAIPLSGRVNKAILYLHGGGYVAGGLPYAQVFGGHLAVSTGRASLCVGYRLAPEDPFPAALDDALLSYREMLTRFAPEDIAFVGESAGGGLVYALPLYLKELNLPLPGKIVSISPWTDMTMQRDVSELQKLDPIILRENVIEYADMYAVDHDRRNPLLSPLFGDLAGMPPSLIIVGSYEILLDDSRLMQQALLEAGCDCRLHVEEGLWHVYVLYGVPEAKEAMRLIEEFLQEELP